MLRRQTDPLVRTLGLLAAAILVVLLGALLGQGSHFAQASQDGLRLLTDLLNPDGRLWSLQAPGDG